MQFKMGEAAKEVSRNESPLNRMLPFQRRGCSSAANQNASLNR
jgi:hypothetical protein